MTIVQTWKPVFLFCILSLIVCLSGCQNADTPVALGANSQQGTRGEIVASGFIKGEEVNIAPEVSGRIVDMRVDRGDTVGAGDILVQLDDAVLQSQRLEAEAGLATAQANLERVLAGARQEEIAAARAALAQKKVEQEGAAQAVLNAQEAISTPLSLNAKINAARTQVSLGEQTVEMAEANLAETQVKYDVYAEQGGDMARIWRLQLQASQSALAQAEAELAGAQRYLNALYAMRTDPLTLEAELHRMEMEHKLAGVQANIAQAELDELEAGPTEEQIALAQAQVQQAEAAVHLVDAQLAQLTLTAPLDGIVTVRSGHTGETAMAGAALLTVANLDKVTLVIYVPENRIGQVQLGQAVAVTVDAFPDRVFEGRVKTIAGEAEFTPRNVQTQEERVKLVFAVNVSIPNPDHALKPGMPADAVIQVDATPGGG